MVDNIFTWVFLGIITLTLALFTVSEALPRHRNRLAAYAAIAEAVVFALMAWLFLNITWGTLVPAWLMALLPVGGVIFALNMAYKRLTGRIIE